MNDTVSNVVTIVSALIGAIIGTLGATFTTDWLSNRREEQRAHRYLVQRYLIQFQSSLELLSSRFKDLDKRKSIMKEEYFETSTLYSLGRVLAYGQILEMIGADYDTVLREHIKAFDKKLDELNTPMNTSLYRYDRQTLAESLIEKDGEDFRVITFLEFRQRYRDVKQLIDPAIEFVNQLKDYVVNEIKPSLNDHVGYIIKDLGKYTSYDQKMSFLKFNWRMQWMRMAKPKLH